MERCAGPPSLSAKPFPVLVSTAVIFIKYNILALSDAIRVRCCNKGDAFSFDEAPARVVAGREKITTELHKSASPHYVAIVIESNRNIVPRAVSYPTIRYILGSSL